MACDCEKAKKEQDNGHDCPEGQHFDKEQGKCVGKETKKEGTLEDAGDSTQGELPTGDPGDQPSDLSGSPCTEGERWDAEKSMCVPVDTKDPGDGQTKGTDKTASVERIASLERQVLKLAKEAHRPTAQVGNSDDRTLTIEQIAKEYPRAIAEGHNYVFHIPLDVLRAVNVAPAKNTERTGFPITEVYRPKGSLSIREAWNKPNKTIKEAVTISGTHATQDLDLDVAIVPGGISFIPVFQFAKVKNIEQGMDRARFFKTTLPGNGSQSAGSTPSEATQTLTSIEVVPSQITGVYLIGDYDEIENSPFDLLQAIVESSAASFDDFVATDMLDTESAEGTLTPGLWIRGDTGATITSSDVVSVALDETGIAYGREYLENQGYLRGGVKPVCVMHPQQWRELITSTNVTSLATRSVPDIWLKAQLEEFMGVQIVVSNAVQAVNNASNDAYNALMFIPKHSYGIGIKRDVTVKFHDIGEDNQVRVNTTWRAKSGVLDATSIVRISTTQ